MVVPGCPPRGVFFLPLTHLETGKGRGRTTQRGRSPVIPHALVRMRTGKAQLSFRTLVSGHFTDENQRKKLLRSAPLSTIILLE